MRLNALALDIERVNYALNTVSVPIVQNNYCKQELQNTSKSPDFNSIRATIGSTGNSAIFKPSGSLRRPESSMAKIVKLG
jgi:hypothetical protein